MLVVCDKCGKEMDRCRSHIHKTNFCSRECKHKYSRKVLCCDYCYVSFERRLSSIKLAKSRGCTNNFCSKACKQLFHVGKNSPTWIKDRTKVKDLGKTIRWSKAMKDWRYKVYERDDYTCKLCNEKGKVLNAHHIVRFIDDKKLRFNINNGITLCESCHKFTYKREFIFEDVFKCLIKVN